MEIRDAELPWHSSGRSTTIGPVRHADGLQRDRAVRPSSAHRRLHERADPGLLPEAAADGRLRQHGDVPLRRARRVPATSIPAWPSRWPRSPSCPDRPSSSSRISIIRSCCGHLWRGHVYHLQGVRRRRPDHERAGRDLDQVEALAFPVSRAARFAPTAIAISSRSRAGSGRRRDGASRRSAARRPQRRDDDSRTKSPRQWPTPVRSSWLRRPSC